jgi:hypothetical protein
MRDKIISFYRKKDVKNQSANLNELEKIKEDIKFLEQCNIGGENMEDTLKQRVVDISKQKITIDEIDYNVLSDKEIDCLNISRGTLSAADFVIMKQHVELTYDLLNKLPYPIHLSKVPFYAACHHEKINGTGYPHGYKGDELPLQARIIAIADVFEGLTAPDRPYKKGYKLSKAMNILRSMAIANEIDVDLFNLFIKQKIYLKYAQSSIDSSQIDEIDESKLLI